MSTPSQTHHRICPLCEATCGLALTVEDGRVTDIRGDSEDAFSEGYICPKGVALQDLHEDPDRLRTPMIREGDQWREATWDEAFAHIDRELTAIVKEHGKEAVGVYIGNPSVHNLALTLYGQALLKALGTPNLFSASTVDQMPKQLAAALLFGTGLSIPIPDIDRCQYLLILGANPVVSNGSLMTAPNIGERLKRLRKRGGKLVVLDPRRTQTAKLADEHHFIRPGTDALFLAAVVHTLFEEKLTQAGRLAEITDGIEAVRAAVQPFSPEVAAPGCGIDGGTIRRIARELAGAERAAVYVRMGASTQAFGSLANWLPEVIHVLTGNLDREGGAMFPLAAHGAGNSKGKPGTGRGLRMGRRTTRVRGLAEIFGEFPVAAMAEEIDTPGDGQIRALVTVAGNPVLSTPNSERLDRALESLDFMVSLDIYLNETTRHANVILPGPTALEISHYDLAFSSLAIQNHARYSRAIFEKSPGMLDEWETILRLVGICSGLGPNAESSMLDEFMARTIIERETALETSPVHGQDTEALLKDLAPRRGPERILDFMLRTGPYGDGFGKKPDGLTLAVLEAHPHGVNLGPLKPRLPDVLRTPSGKIELAPDLLLKDLERLRGTLSDEPNGSMVLIGRRHLRSNNSWMHNSHRLVKGKPRCTLLINPADAERLDLGEGANAAVTSRAGTVTLPVELSDDMMPGVVSIPHGWGHDAPGIRLGVAQEHAGTNSNTLADEEALDVPSGNAVLNGIPVTVIKAVRTESSSTTAAFAK